MELSKSQLLRLESIGVVNASIIKILLALPSYIRMYLTDRNKLVTVDPGKDGKYQYYLGITKDTNNEFTISYSLFGFEGEEDRIIFSGKLDEALVKTIVFLRTHKYI